MRIVKILPTPSGKSRSGRFGERNDAGIRLEGIRCQRLIFSAMKFVRVSEGKFVNLSSVVSVEIDDHATKTRVRKNKYSAVRGEPETITEVVQSIRRTRLLLVGGKTETIEGEEVLRLERELAS